MPNICFNMLLESTALQRLEGIRRLNGDSGLNLIHIAIGAAAIIVLLAVLVIINRRQNNGKIKPMAEIFADYADKRGLTERETQLLWAIAEQAGLKRFESVFTLPTAYDRGEIKLTQTYLTEHRNQEIQQLQVELSFLREKLGFHRNNRAHLTTEANQEDLSSRQIRVGKKLYIRHHRSTQAGDIESVIVETDAKELTIQFTRPVEIDFGQTWRCRYYSGASLWEFETTVISCSGTIVSLKHCDEVRLINRRKFLRVPVKRRAIIAAFPLMKRGDHIGAWPRKKTELMVEPVAQLENLLEPPAFVPAIVTELGGPGLRVIADIEVKVNDRVLIIFALNELKEITQQKADVSRNLAGEKAIESLAIVRHVKATGNDGRSIALELTGIDDDDIDELIRVTNEASIEVNNKKKQQSPAHELVTN